MFTDSTRAVFDGKNFGTVATLNADGSPHTSVVWVRLDGDDVLFSTLRGRKKDRNLARDQRVSITVVDHENPYHYVEVRGSVTIQDDPAGELIQELSQKYFGKPWKHDEGRIIVRISPEHVYERGAH
ncbi:PPOX class F420-dependent oxidoreductase [Pseudonocardiaceae bacterium YIM PH 21723]|nr:PPOX class F420-dependent oxidoreductase [Pseudonocardiaceae bacterium YIM PH 21723]